MIAEPKPQTTTKRRVFTRKKERKKDRKKRRKERKKDMTEFLLLKEFKHTQSIGRRKYVKIK